MTMRISLASSALFLSASLLGSCWSDCVTGTGPVERQILSVTEHEGLELRGSLDVRLAQGEQRSVEVEGQANLIGLVTSEVKNGILILATSKCYRTDKPFIVHVTMPKVSSLHVSGSGEIRGVGTFNMDQLEVGVMGSGDVDVECQASQVTMNVSGSGDVRVKGRANSCVATVTGSGDVKAGDLITEWAEATVTGSGDVSVHASNALKATVTGSGSVKYSGSPSQVDKNVTGSGEVVAVP